MIITIAISEEELKLIDKKAISEDRNRSQLFRIAMRDYLKTKGRTND
jgi:metal-responsive CopG/Arc/MetJ family transcriptional regulator